MKTRTGSLPCQCKTCKRVRTLEYKMEHAKALIGGDRQGVLTLSMNFGGKIETLHIDESDEDGLNEAVDLLQEEIDRAVAYVDRYGHRRRRRFIPLNAR